MEKHIESYMRKVYSEYVSEVHAKLIAKRVETLVANGMALEDASIAANKAMSMTKMKETKVSSDKRTMEVKDR